MFLVGMISWWYGHGWRGQLNRLISRLKRTAAFFSIGQLASTLFAPFRQISAQKIDGPLGVIVRAFFDQLVSRIIGGIVRTFTILFGIIALVVQALYEVVILIAWLFVPLLPIAGLIMLAIGWVPIWT